MEDKIIRYAKAIQKMAHGAMFDYEDREALYGLASEIECARELELQEPLGVECPDCEGVHGPDVPCVYMGAEAEDRLLVRREA